MSGSAQEVSFVYLSVILIGIVTVSFEQAYYLCGHILDWGLDGGMRACLLCCIVCLEQEFQAVLGYNACTFAFCVMNAGGIRGSDSVDLSLASSIFIGSWFHEVNILIQISHLCVGCMSAWGFVASISKLAFSRIWCPCVVRQSLSSS